MLARQETLRIYMCNINMRIHVACDQDGKSDQSQKTNGWTVDITRNGKKQKKKILAIVLADTTTTGVQICFIYFTFCF